MTSLEMVEAITLIVELLSKIQTREEEDEILDRLRELISPQHKEVR